MALIDASKLCLLTFRAVLLSEYPVKKQTIVDDMRDPDGKPTRSGLVAVAYECDDHFADIMLVNGCTTREVEDQPWEKRRVYWVELEGST